MAKYKMSVWDGIRFFINLKCLLEMAYVFLLILNVTYFSSLLDDKLLIKLLKEYIKVYNLPMKVIFFEDATSIVGKRKYVPTNPIQWSGLVFPCLYIHLDFRIRKILLQIMLMTSSHRVFREFKGYCGYGITVQPHVGGIIYYFSLAETTDSTLMMWRTVWTSIAQIVWFSASFLQTQILFQDTIHEGAKLRTRFLKIEKIVPLEATLHLLLTSKPFLRRKKFTTNKRPSFTGQNELRCSGKIKSSWSEGSLTFQVPGLETAYFYLKPMD